MRFNPNYWDKTLPPSAIQFLTFYYSEYGYLNNNKQAEEIANKNYNLIHGRINQTLETNKQISFKELSQFIKKNINPSEK